MMLLVYHQSLLVSRKVFLPLCLIPSNMAGSLGSLLTNCSMLLIQDFFSSNDLKWISSTAVRTSWIFGNISNYLWLSLVYWPGIIQQN